MDITSTDGILMGLTALTTGIATQFFNYLRNSRQDQQKHESEEDDKIIAGYQLTIAKLDDRIQALEKAYDTMRKEHVDCIVIQAELRGEINALHKQLGNNPDSILPSSKPPPVAPPPKISSPHITPHNYDHPSIPIRSIEPLDQK